MKLVELLLEKMLAGVHTNSDKSLYVIRDLIEKEFGPSFAKIRGGCLAAQMVFSMSAASGIESKYLIYAINKSDLSAGFMGAKLEDLWKVLNGKKIHTPDETVIFELSLETPDITQAVKESKIRTACCFHYRR